MPIDWTKQPLGEVPDAQLARELGVHRSTVTRARRARRIRGTHEEPRIAWERVPLGEYPDGDIASSLEVPIHRVTQARRKRGVPPWTPTGIDWDAVDWRRGNVALAVELGVSRKTVAASRRARRLVERNTLRRPKGIDWDRQPLGKVPDRELAAELGVTPWAVAQQREKRGLARAPARRPIDWRKEPLGEVVDSVLAAKLGVSPSTVQRARARLGIPPKGHG